MTARDVAEAIGAGIGRLVLALGGYSAVRAHHEAKYGRCRRCDEVLSGHAPAQICETCHADEALAVVGGSGGDA